MKLELIMKQRKNILEDSYQVKKDIEILLNKDFFKELLKFYQFLESLDGMKNWMYLHQNSQLEDCDGCTSGKMQLLETLMFQLNETPIIENIKKLHEQIEVYEELKDYDI